MRKNPFTNRRRISSKKKSDGDYLLSNKAQERQLLKAWNATAGEYGPEQCVHERFEEQVKRSPGAEAVVFENRFLTYEELNRRANQLAHYLISLGIGPEHIVGIFLEKEPELLIAVLAVLKAGAAYLPLDADYPQERLMFMLDDSKACLIITRHDLRNSLGHPGLGTITLDAGEQSAGKQPSNPQKRVNPDNLAYVIYTSGSTGLPKAVMVPHRGLSNVQTIYQTLYNLGPGDRHLQMASFSFDVFTGDWIRALCLGGSLILVPKEVVADSQALQALIRQRKPTCAEFVPAVIKNLVRYLEQTGEDLNSFRYIMVGSDTYHLEDYDRTRNICDPQTRLLNVYGATETTIEATWFEKPRKTLFSAPVTPIGRPMLNYRAYLLDDHWQPMPVGVPGKLFIGGPGVCRGYLNQPDLTAEKFIPDPFSPEPGVRLYSTDDLGRYLPDGVIEFGGRSDNQVKVHGFRIEPGEIETVLRRHPLIKEAVVLAHESEPGLKRLAAYMVCSRECKPLPEDLRLFLKEQLPEYMIPSFFMILEALPLTPNGKVDLRALPAPGRTQLETGKPFNAPRTPFEEALASVWSEILGLERVGIHDDFFTLGGHSLLAAQLLARVREMYQVEISPRLFFEQLTTVAKLAQNIEQSGPREDSLKLPPLQPVPHTGPLPLSFPQEAVWFLNQLAPHNRAYNVQVAIRFIGRLDVSALERTLSELIRRHEILRTSFHEMDAKPVQVIHPPRRMTIPIVDLQAVPAGKREAAAGRLAADLCAYSFDLTQIPLIRWTLLHLEERDHLLVSLEHHFVHDGWTMALLLREMKALYEAFSAGRPSPLPEPALQFADFASWQRQLLQGRFLDKQLAYWKAKLAQMIPLELPADRPRPKFPSFRGRLHAVELDAGQYRALKQFSSAQGVTLFITMLTAFKLLLYRYTERTDIALGSSIANRRLRETEGLLGMILNTIVLRTDLSGNPTVREALRKVRQTALEAYAHQDLPFEKLVAELQPQRETDRNPLFQISFAFHDAPMPDLEFPELNGEVRYIHNHSAKFDLLLLVIPRGEQRVGLSPKEKEQGMLLEWEYNTDLFEAHTIERMAGHYRNVLQHMLRNPDRCITDLALMDEAEKRRVLIEWNETQTAYPQEQCIHELFEDQVKRTPNATAVVHEEKELSYKELNARANQLAHYLQELGIKPDDRVAICVERSLEMVLGLLSILKAGGAYVPLDPIYPQERLAFMQDDSKARILLTQSSQSSIIHHQASGVKVICLDRQQAIIAKQSIDNPALEVRPPNLAYVIYTSGSTGKPKGVMVQHANVVAMLHAFEEVAAAGEQLIGTSLCPFSFDVSVWELFSILCFGGTLHLIPQKILMEPSLLAQSLIKSQITSAYIPPALLPELLGPLERLKKDINLDRMLVGVEPIPQYQLERFKKLSERLRIVNGYGPTETTVSATFFNFVSATDPKRRTPIGRPAANDRIYLLDHRLQPMPIGISGEVYIGGTGVARGYLNRPDLTAEKFMPDPFSHKPGMRLYKTGDLARYLADGNIEFLGRMDYQVKIRGFRIELGEIEAALNQHPAMKEAVVTAWEDEQKNKRLVAYLVFKPGQKTATKDLRFYLKNKLPEYMMPSAFVVLKKLPMTPNDKVDRKALPKPEKQSPDLEKGYVAPCTPIEEEMAGIWQKVLGIDRIGRHDPFFEIGGHSLLAAQVVSRAREAFQVALSLHSLFEFPTVAALVECIVQIRRSEQPSTLPRIISEARPAEIPLSFSQYHLWLKNQQEPDNPHYGIPTATRLTGELHIPALRQTLNEIIGRHESLRTHFKIVNGKPVQRIDASLEINLPVIDLQHLPPEKQEAELRCLAKAEELKPFDLVRDPLVRGTLLRLAPDQHVLLLTIHHVVADGWSMGIFIREMNILYPAFCSGEPSPLASLSIQYADFAIWQRKWLQGEVLERELAFWKQKLAGDLRAPNLPFDRPRPEAQACLGSARIYRTSADLTEALRNLGRQEQCTLFMTLLAVFKVFLYTCTGQEDIVVSTPITNRHKTELEPLIGHFVNILVLRTDLSGNPYFREIMRRVRETALEAYVHQDLPFMNLVESLPSQDIVSRAPVFNLLNFAEPELVLPGLEIDSLFIPEIEATHDLELWVKEQGPSIRFDLICNTDVFAEQTIDALMESFQNLINRIVQNPDARLQILTETEKDGVLLFRPAMPSSW